MNRREFIQASGIAGGATLLSPLWASSSPVERKEASDTLLKGVCDIHIHRETTDDLRVLAKAASEAGYRAIMSKPSYWPCGEAIRAVEEEFPNLRCFGGLIMTPALGDRVNFFAVEQAIQAQKSSFRCVWMPTQSANYPPTVEANHPGPTIPVADARGRILPEVVRVMELCAEADIIFASGHSSPTESLAMAKLAQEVGVKKYVVTHANSRIWKFTHDQVKQAIDLGAYIEYTYLPRIWGPGTHFARMPRQSREEFIAYARLAPERCFISTDLGSRGVGIPEPVDGMRQCMSELIEAGVPQGEIDLLTRVVPARLLNLTD